MVARFIPQVRDEVAIVANTRFCTMLLKHPEGYESSIAGSVVVFSSPQGFRLGVLDTAGYIEYTSSPTLHVSPLVALHAMWLFDDIRSLTIEGDDEVWEFNQLALAGTGELDEHAAKKFAEKFGILFPHTLMGTLHAMLWPEDLSRIFDRYTTDDGAGFKRAVQGMTRYMLEYGDITPVESQWLEERGLLA